jgi:hypothetical protein
MNISSDLPSPVQRMATPPQVSEAAEGRETVPDHDADDARLSLKPYQGTKVDTKA